MKKPVILAILASTAFAFGVTGLGWDLPSEKRAARLLPPHWDKAELFDRLAGGWEKIYREAEGSTPLAAERAGKYSTRLEGRFTSDFKTPLPAPELWNSYRSMLIRTRYPDESLPLSDLARMDPGKLKFRPPSFIYGGGYLYPLGAYYYVLSKAGTVEPLPMRHALEKTGSIGDVYLAGRLLSAAAFTGICLLVFLICLRLAPSAAIWAAFAVTLAFPALSIYAHFLTPHLWSSFWALAAVYFSLRSLPGLDLKPLLWAGACLGVAAGSYWIALHAGLLMLAILLSPAWQDLNKAALKRLGLAVLLCAAVFFALNPYLPFNLAEAVKEFFPGGPRQGPAPETGPYALFVKVFPGTLGPAFALLFPVGCLWGLFSGRPLIRNLSAATIILTWAASYTIYPDYPSLIRRFFPCLITGVILSVLFIDRVTARLKPAFRAAIFLLALAPGLGMSSAYTLNFLDASGPHSTFGRMADKLDSLPAGSTLGMTEFPQPYHMPAFRLDRWRLRMAEEAVMPSLPDSQLPEYLLVNHFQKAPLSDLLAGKYELAAGFYPRPLMGFTPSPLLGAANSPIELFRLKDPGGGE